MSDVAVTAAELTIADDETRGLTVNGSGEAVTVTVDEADEPVTVHPTVRLGSRPTAAVTVTVAGVSATSTEVTVTPPTLEFTRDNWDTGRMLTVTVAPDLDAEDGVATVTFEMEGGDYAGLSADSLTVEVDDDEVVSTRVALTVSPAQVWENAAATPVTVTGTLDSGTRTAATAVTVTVTSGTATSGTDFATVSAVTLTIAENTQSATATFPLTPTDDTILEGSETVEVSGTTDATGLTVDGTVVTLLDDDLRVDLAVDPTEVPEEGGRVVFTVTVTPVVGDTGLGRPAETRVVLAVEEGTAASE